MLWSPDGVKRDQLIRQIKVRKSKGQCPFEVTETKKNCQKIVKFSCYGL